MNIARQVPTIDQVLALPPCSNPIGQGPSTMDDSTSVEPGSSPSAPFWDWHSYFILGLILPLGYYLWTRFPAFLRYMERSLWLHATGQLYDNNDGIELASLSHSDNSESDEPVIEISSEAIIEVTCSECSTIVIQDDHYYDCL